MKIKTFVELQPFAVPDYVVVNESPQSRGEGMQKKPKFHLSELDDSTLDELCEQFKKDVFIKARAK